MIYQFNNNIPVVHPTAFVHPQAAVTGCVIIGKNCYIGPGAALRGDWGKIVLEDGCNVQENCTVHMFPGTTVLLKAGAHIGHGAVIHGATIGKNCLVGMNAVIMDNAVLGDECIVGALSFIKAAEVFEARSLIVGNPAKRMREVSDAMIRWKTAGTELYQQLPHQMATAWAPCEPLTEVPEGYGNAGDEHYRAWNQTAK
jgi:phenylacetic acid degradation protein